MPIALTLEPTEYVVKSERNLASSEQTVFLIRPLGALKSAQLKDKAKITPQSRWAEVDGFKFQVPDNSAEIAYDTVLDGLAGWRNFKFTDGSDCAFDKDAAVNISRLDDVTRAELYVAIESLSRVTETESGNSRSPQNGLPKKTATPRSAKSRASR